MRDSDNGNGRETMRTERARVALRTRMTVVDGAHQWRALCNDLAGTDTGFNPPASEYRHNGRVRRSRDRWARC